MTAQELRRSANHLNKRTKQIADDLIVQVPKVCFDEEAEVSDLCSKKLWLLLDLQKKINDPDLGKLLQSFRIASLYRVKTFDEVNKELSKMKMTDTVKEAYALSNAKHTLMSTFDEALRFQKLGEDI